MTLDQLPTCVLYHLVDFVEHADFEELVLTCKSIYEACTRLLKKHNDLRKRWRHLELWRQCTPMLALRDITRDPRLAAWIRTADLEVDKWLPRHVIDQYRSEHGSPKHYDPYESEETVEDQLGWRSWQDLADFVAIYSPCLRAAIDWQAFWDELVTSYDQDTLSVNLLLCLLPNATCILIPETFALEPWIPKVIAAAREAQSQGSPGSLSKLKRLQTAVQARKQLAPFLQSPSLVSIDCHHLPWPQLELGLSPAPFAAILSARLNVDGLSRYSLGHFLRQTQSLKKLHIHDRDRNEFTYDLEDMDDNDYPAAFPEVYFDEDERNRERPNDYFDLVKLVEKWSAHSLETFILDFKKYALASSMAKARLLSFKKFKRLKQLVIHSDLLTHSVAPWMSWLDSKSTRAVLHSNGYLKDCLPPSLAELHLICNGSEENFYVVDGLFGETRSQLSSCRGLKHIVLHKIDEGRPAEHWRSKVEEDYTSYAACVAAQEQWSSDTMFPWVRDWASSSVLDRARCQELWAKDCEVKKPLLVKDWPCAWP